MVRKVSLITSVLVFMCIIFVLIWGIFILKVDMQVLLLIALAIACCVALIHGYSFEELIDGMKSSVNRAMGALLIFILIGATIGSWILSGAVPTIIYYGLEIISPRFFLPAGLLICSITSLVTGTSWGTVGTVGIAMMGMGMSLGIPAPMIAGMVVSGAFLGDKMSPMSDTTNLSAASVGTNLYSHIKCMLYTTVPAFIVSIILYWALGNKYASNVADFKTIRTIMETLDAQFKITIFAIIPMAVVLGLSLMKKSTIPSMFLGVLAGGICAMIIQGSSLGEVLYAINNGYDRATGIEIVDNLLLRGGIMSMMSTFALSFIALCLGGVLEKVGYLDILVLSITKRVKSVANLITLVIISCIFSNLAMGEIYLSIILNASLYNDIFKKYRLKKYMLSRVLEEGATMTGGLIPWTTAGAFIAGTLGVRTVEYLPFAFLNILNPVISIAFAYIGLFVFYEKDNQDRGRERLDP